MEETESRRIEEGMGCAERRQGRERPKEAQESMRKTMSQFVELDKYLRRYNEGDLFGEASVTDQPRALGRRSASRGKKRRN